MPPLLAAPRRVQPRVSHSPLNLFMSADVLHRPYKLLIQKKKRLHMTLDSVSGTSTRTASTRSTPAVRATAAGTTGGRAAAAHAADSAGVQRRRSPAEVAARLASQSDKCRGGCSTIISSRVFNNVSREMEGKQAGSGVCEKEEEQEVCVFCFISINVTWCPRLDLSETSARD